MPGLTRRDAVRVAAAGLLVVVGYHVFLNVGTKSTSAGISALVVALAPGMTVVLAGVVGVDRIRLRQVLGLGVAFAGVALVVAIGTGQGLALENAKGPLIVLGAPLAFALYNVILKPLLGRYDLLALTAATSLVGIVGLLPLVRRSTVDTVVDASAKELALVVYLGVLATLLGYIGWNTGLRGLGPTRAVAYAYAISPLAVLMGALFLDEPVTVWIALGAALVVGGIAAMQWTPRRERASASVERWASRSAPSRSAS